VEFAGEGAAEDSATVEQSQIIERYGPSGPVRSWRYRMSSLRISVRAPSSETGIPDRGKYLGPAQIRLVR